MSDESFSTIQRQPEPEYMDLPEEAEAYAAADFSTVNQLFVDRVLAAVSAGDLPRAPLHVLDLGAGPCDIPLRLLAARPDWRMVAADASPAMLAIGRRAAAALPHGRGLSFVCCDVKHPPLAEASFDLIISNSILHHITDAAALWSTVRRAARPGALLVLRDLRRPVDAAMAQRIVMQYAGDESALLRQEFHRSLLSAYTPDEVREQLARAGLPRLVVSVASDRHLDVVGQVGG